MSGTQLIRWDPSAWGQPGRYIEKGERIRGKQINSGIRIRYIYGMLTYMQHIYRIHKIT